MIDAAKALDDAIKDLEEKKSKLVAQLAALQKAKNSIRGGGPRRGPGKKKAGRPAKAPKRGVASKGAGKGWSAAAKARASKRMKAYWAAKKKPTKKRTRKATRKVAKKK